MSVIPLKGMRGAIARNMTLGWQAPRVAMTVEVDMSACLGQQVGVTPQVLSAVAGALRDHPALNAWLTPEGNPLQVLEKLDTDDNVLLVSHQPLVGSLISLLQYGHLRSPQPMGTASLAELEGDWPLAGLMSLNQVHHV